MTVASTDPRGNHRCGTLLNPRATVCVKELMALGGQIRKSEDREMLALFWFSLFPPLKINATSCTSLRLIRI